jgi:hypothetical protein
LSEEELLQLGEIRWRDVGNGLSSLETNVIVTEILDAARQSAATGKTVNLKP